MQSDLKGLGDFMAWQTDEIPGPSYKVYTFWISPPRTPGIKQNFKLPNNLKESEIIDLLETWCEEVYPMFNHTDLIVRYGWE